MEFPKINLHIHSIFSDGKNSIKQIIKKSLKLGLNYIAITDHFTNSWKANVIPTLDTVEKIEFYLKEISKCQNYLRENNKNLNLFKGIEIDIESSETFIKKLIQPEKFDIILFEYLETPEGISFIKELIDFWKKTIEEDDFPILGLAHFDPSFFIHESLDTLIHFLVDYDIYFEFNSWYPDYYSRQNELFFKKLKGSGYSIPVAIGCDSHSSRRLADIEEPLELIEFYCLEDNLKQFLNLLQNK